MDKKYFEEYYQLERNHWWFKARIEILQIHLTDLVKKIPEKQNLKILNVGAGTGFTTELLSRYGSVTSVEYDTLCCNMVKEKLGLVFENASITDLPYNDNEFNLVTAYDVIEHIEDDAKAISELIRVTKKGGIIFTTVPAYMSLWSHHDVVNQHYRRYTRQSFLKVWKNFENKIEIIYQSYFNFYLFPPIYLFRKFSKIIPGKLLRKGAGSDFTIYKSGLIDKLLFKIMVSEKIFIKKQISLPFGVSFLCSFRKK